MQSKIRTSVKVFLLVFILLFGSSISLKGFLQNHLQISHLQKNIVSSSNPGESFVQEIDQMQAESPAGAFAEVPVTANYVLPEQKSDTRSEQRTKNLFIYQICNINNLPINIFDRNQKVINTLKLSSAPAIIGSLVFCLRV